MQFQDIFLAMAAAFVLVEVFKLALRSTSYYFERRRSDRMMAEWVRQNPDNLLPHRYQRVGVAGSSRVTLAPGMYSDGLTDGMRDQLRLNAERVDAFERRLVELTGLVSTVGVAEHESAMALTSIVDEHDGRIAALECGEVHPESARRRTDAVRADLARADNHHPEQG